MTKRHSDERGCRRKKTNREIPTLAEWVAEQLKNAPERSTEYARRGCANLRTRRSRVAIRFSTHEAGASANGGRPAVRWRYSYSELLTCGGTEHVSQIEKIAADFQALTKGVERTQTVAASTDNKVGEIIGRAAHAGFVGIAQALSRVQALVREIRAVLAGVGNSVGESARPIAAAPKEMTPQQTIALLTPSLEITNTAHKGIGATIAKIDEARQLVATVLQGGQPGPLISMLDEIKQTLLQITGRINATKQNISAAIAEARKLGEV